MKNILKNNIYLLLLSTFIVSFVYGSGASEIIAFGCSKTPYSKYSDCAIIQNIYGKNVYTCVSRFPKSGMGCGYYEAIGPDPKPSF